MEKSTIVSYFLSAKNAFIQDVKVVRGIGKGRHACSPKVVLFGAQRRQVMLLQLNAHYVEEASSVASGRGRSFVTFSPAIISLLSML